MSPSEVVLKEYTLEEVSKHTKHDDCWLIIGNSSNGRSIMQASWKDCILNLSCYFC